VLEQRGDHRDEQFFDRLLQVLNRLELKARPNVKCLNTVLSCIAQMRELLGIDEPAKLDVRAGSALDWESMIKSIPAGELEDKVEAELQAEFRKAGAPAVVDQPQRALDGPPRRQALPYRPSSNGDGPAGNGH
jgi:hypothetical protein